MKIKLFLILFLICFLSGISLKANAQTDFLSCVEQNIYKNSFSQEHPEVRLSRIEQTMFGRTNNTMPFNQRMDLIGKYWSICKTPENNNITINNYEQNVDIGYPAVDQIEQQVLGQLYAQENIYQRLNRLETTVFGQVSTGSLQDRVDRLRDFAPNSKISSTNNADSTIISFSSYENYNSFNNSANSSEDLNIVLFDLEKKLLGTVYMTEPTDIRLARLENRIFGQSSDDYPMEERVQRIMAYADAQQSGDYYEDQSKIRKYANMANGIKALSVILMILQALLL